MLCVHILNLILGEDLKEINAFVAKVSKVVRYMKSTSNKNQTFSSFMEMLGIECKSLLCLDVPTRWNSTYLMLETAKNLRKCSLEWTLNIMVIRRILGPRKIVVVWDLHVWVISKILGHLWLSWGFVCYFKCLLWWDLCYSGEHFSFN